MRSRTVREGSVGLAILLGIAVFGGLFLWLRGFSPGNRGYQITIRFPNVEGMQVGAPVLYRGVSAGKISAIRVSANYAEVDVKISPATIIMPKNVAIEARQSGLVGETFIDMTPNTQLPEEVVGSDPFSSTCDEAVIICNGSYLEGTASVTFTELLSSMINFTNTFSSPEFFGELRTLTRNFASAAEGVDTLAGEVTNLSRSVRGELGTLSKSATASANSIGSAANQFGLTAEELRALIATNRTALVGTLDNINQTVTGVRTIVNTLAPVIEEGDFVANLQDLSANAAEASANLRNLSGTVGSAENLVLLQQTLDSARATFQNAQKITADLDDLTGDPTFRENIRRLVNGLGGLVSSAEQLQQQTQLAQALAVAQTSENQAVPQPTEVRSKIQPKATLKPDEKSPETVGESSQPQPADDPLPLDSSLADDPEPPHAQHPEADRSAEPLKLPSRSLRE